MKLENKVIVVTGATRGIGRSIAEAFIKNTLFFLMTRVYVYNHHELAAPTGSQNAVNRTWKSLGEWVY